MSNILLFPFYPSNVIACLLSSRRAGAFSASEIHCESPALDGTHVVSFFWFPRPCEDYPAALLRRRWRPYGQLYPPRSFPLSSSCRVTWYRSSLYFVYRGGYPSLAKRGHYYLSCRAKGLNLNVVHVQVWYVAVNLTSRGSKLGYSSNTKWGRSYFEMLRRVVKGGNTILTILISLFEEISAIDPAGRVIATEK